MEASAQTNKSGYNPLRYEGAGAGRRSTGGSSIGSGGGTSSSNGLRGSLSAVAVETRGKEGRAPGLAQSDTVAMTTSSTSVAGRTYEDSPLQQRYGYPPGGTGGGGGSFWAAGRPEVETEHPPEEVDQGSRSGARRGESFGSAVVREISSRNFGTVMENHAEGGGFSGSGGPTVSPPVGVQGMHMRNAAGGVGAQGGVEGKVERILEDGRRVVVFSNGTQKVGLVLVFDCAFGVCSQGFLRSRICQGCAQYKYIMVG
ncbi:unnamed protein product [Choristocarpus tenellus]